MDTYIAIFVMQTSIPASGYTSYERNIILLKAASDKAARLQLEQYTRSLETIYTNQQQETVAVDLHNIISLEPVLREGFDKQGVWELAAASSDAANFDN